MSEVHARARTTPRIRLEIKSSTDSMNVLAKRYHISRLTVRKWKRRESPEDRSHRPHRLSTTLTAEQESVVMEAAPIKTFKAYEPGFVHVDIKYLPQMPGETQRRYLFVGIDRATRWVFLHIYTDQSESSSTDFLRRLKL